MFSFSQIDFPCYHCQGYCWGQDQRSRCSLFRKLTSLVITVKTTTVKVKISVITWRLLSRPVSRSRSASEVVPSSQLTSLVITIEALVEVEVSLLVNPPTTYSRCLIFKIINVYRYCRNSVKQIIGRDKESFISVANKSTVLKYLCISCIISNLRVKSQLLKILGSNSRIIGSKGLTNDTQ
jgi:hypothetical protein